MFQLYKTSCFNYISIKFKFADTESIIIIMPIALVSNNSNESKWLRYLLQFKELHLVVSIQFRNICSLINAVPPVSI